MEKQLTWSFILGRIINEDQTRTGAIITGRICNIEYYHELFLIFLHSNEDDQCAEVTNSITFTSVT